MRIAILSISSRPTLPPNEYGYGGMTRVSWWLSEEMAQLGHDVTLFATEGSKPPEGVRLAEYPQIVRNELAPERLEELDRATAAWFDSVWLDQFDIVHELSHRMPIAVFCDGPIMATMQNPNKRRRWGHDIRNMVALSPAHSQLYGGIPYVYNGVEDVGFQPVKNGPFLVMGPMQPHKGVFEAIQAAVVAQEPLVLAGHRWDSPYGQKCAVVVAQHENVSYVGEVQGDFKRSLLHHAKAAILYMRWPEPGCLFGLEAMSAGTPIIGSTRGCIPNYVVHGTTGFICKSISSMAEAMTHIDMIDPAACRARYEENFTIQIQAQKYLPLYKRTISGETW